ncbi:MAG: hypothetical protein IJS47_06650 [Clostridia bacterium]|nr:hypothetical protein [Clostridia bacterium]
MKKKEEITKTQMPSSTKSIKERVIEGMYLLSAGKVEEVFEKFNYYEKQMIKREIISWYRLNRINPDYKILPPALREFCEKLDMELEMAR